MSAARVSSGTGEVACTASAWVTAYWVLTSEGSGMSATFLPHGANCCSAFRRAIVLWPLFASCVPQREVPTGPGSPEGPVHAEPLVLSFGLRYLPYGVPVPEGTKLAAVPEPYSFARHGAGIPNTQPEANIVERPGFVPPPPPIAQGSDSYWLRIMPSTPAQFFGISQINDAQLSLQLPATSGSTRYLYAPTILPSGGSCVEATTLHSRAANSTTVHRQGWYNWCVGPAGAWWVQENMDPTFQSKYVRHFNGELGLHVSIVTPNNGSMYGGCWYGHLYNFNVGGWEQKFSYCGTGTVYLPPPLNPTWGWTAWESYNLISESSCPSVQGVRAQVIVVNVSATGAAQFLTDFPSNIGAGSSSSQCWTGLGGAPYTFIFPSTSILSTWQADTPTQ